MPTKVFLIDDDPRQRRHSAALLESAGYSVEEASGGRQALDGLRAAGAGEVAVCLLDLDRADPDGLEVLRQVRAGGVALPVIALTAGASFHRAVEAMRAGASDVVAKPTEGERLDAAIREALSGARPAGAVRGPARREHGLTFDALVAVSSATRHAVRLARRAAQSDVPVLIEGESGTGKEVFARAIHCESPRAGRPFVAVNCGALPANLLDAILFGGEERAWAGAAADRAGGVREASGGTLFLDEVGELPPHAQVRLLRALQVEAEPMDGAGPVPPDVRLISASDRDLRALVDQRSFRDDLFYRISVFPIRLPPLRERREDIPALARRFLAKGLAQRRVAVEDFSPEAMERLTGAPWPGNARELENAVERALVMAEGRRIEAEDLNPTGARGPAGGAPPPRAPEPGSLQDETGRDHLLIGPDGHIRPLRRIEADAVRKALRLYRGRIAEAARRLGIGRSTLYRKLDELRLDRNGS